MLVTQARLFRLLKFRKLAFMKDTNDDVCGALNDKDSETKGMEEVDELDISWSNSLKEYYEPCEPISGMSFPSNDAVKLFYKQYARRKGFKFKIRSSRRKGSDGNMHYFVLACTQEGNRRSLKQSRTVRYQCGAKITVSLKEDGLWYIMKAVLEHSHELLPTKSMMFKVNKNVSVHVKRTMETNHETRMNKFFRSLVHDSEENGSLSFVEQELRNHVKKEIHAIGEETDGKALRRFFTKMREQERNFFYDIDFDDNFQVKNVFWVDARSKATYDSFGDVVNFDTTYLTNKYYMPLVAFTGTNHHGQSALFGCGLLSTYNTEAFVWLFQSWLRCMSGNPPKGILTDQCTSIQDAIELVFPTTRHRWCLWHIMKKVPEKLNFRAKHNMIEDSMKRVIHDTITEGEFEDQWNQFIREFNLQDNQWLSDLYNERHRWVPSFLKNDFWAGMSTTQRSESKRACFDGYIDSTTPLRQFLELYDKFLHDKAEEEFEADFRSFNTTIHCESNSLLEKQFQSSYTNAKFYEVQGEFRAKMNCVPSLKSVKGSICTYEVLEDMEVGGQPKEALFEVTFSRNNHDVSCKCLLFEFRGIMCRHSLIVLALERVKQVPSKYILPRWSKNIEWRHVYTNSSDDTTQLEPKMQRYDSMCKDFYEVAKVAAESEDVTDFLQNSLRDLKEKVQSMVTSTRESLYTNGEKEEEVNEEKSDNQV